MNPYQALANQIVLQAVKDWRSSVKKLKKRPWYEPARQIKNECERFFLSDWFTFLTDVDGAILLRKLEQEVLCYDK